MMNAVHPVSSMNRPDALPFEPFQDARAAVARLAEIYARNTAFLRAAFREVLKEGAKEHAKEGAKEGANEGAKEGSGTAPERARAYYPAIRIVVETYDPIDTRLSYGHVAEPGIYQTTITQPELFRDYLIEQVGQLLQNHRVAVEVGESDSPIPLHFAFPEGAYVEGEHLEALKRPLRDLFDVPDLAVTDDAIVNGSWRGKDGEPKPLAPFTAQRVDYSLHRLQHYTSTAPAHFQNFVLFTNYQFYVDEFCARARALMASGNEDYEMLVEPGNRITRRGENGPGDEGQGVRLPQMPAYHLVRGDHSGITLVNIGVGPSNAKTITDHIAVLRPHAWLMLGHCAGLRDSQRLGDYVLAHGYVREDHVLDADLPTWVPVPALAEVQVALEQAVQEVAGLSGWDLKRIMRTGTVATIDNRNWELRDHVELVERFAQSRAIALDMESATIAANGFRFRVPYGTLLCVSDKPLHGELKLPGMASVFYRRQVNQHLEIGIRALERLRDMPPERLHSRKLRTFMETAFQ
ncbi:AMP nucleosidase [Achromobacter spanius]